MATPSSSLFTRLVSACRLLSLRTDVDDIILELLGRFSLEKVYADNNNYAYQQLVITLLAQLNTIFYIQRLSLPPEHQAAAPLGFLVTWEVALRTIEFVLNIIADGRDSLWDAQATCNEHLSRLLLSVFRILTLHPKVPTNLRAKGRRDRFTHVYRSLECVCDRYPNSNSCLLLVCKDITNALRIQPDALAPPNRLKYELPSLATKLVEHCLYQLSTYSRARLTLQYSTLSLTVCPHTASLVSYQRMAPLGTG
jgi:hypothetical protein